MDLSVMGAATVLVAAPPSLHRQGLVATLHDQWPALACTLAADAGQLLALLRQQAFELVVLDSALSGLALPLLLPQLRRLRGGLPTLVLTGRRLSPRLRQHLLQAGADALLCQSATPATAVAAVAALLRGAGGGIQADLPARSPGLPPMPFSEREAAVLRLAMADCCNQTIADQLCMSVRTVESHRRALLQKTGARTLTGLVALALRQGWLIP